MTTPYSVEALAAEHATDLRRRAAISRLAALARCCRPGAWARIAQRTVRSVRGSPDRPTRVSTSPCCTGA
jgi:hypothetical protein